MSSRFDPRQGLVIVRVELTGPLGSALLRFALDTGATGTIVNAGPLVVAERGKLHLALSTGV